MVDDPILVMGAQLLQAGVLDPPPSEHVRNVERMRELGITQPQPIPDEPGTFEKGDNDSPVPAMLVSNWLLSRALSNGDRFWAVFRMTVTEFKLLHARLLTALSCARQSTGHAGVDTRHSHPVLSTAEQLLLWLLHLKGTPTSVLMLVFEDFTRTTVLHYVDHVTWAVNEVWEGLVRWPDADERKLWQGALSIDPMCIGIIDGTLAEIERPSVSAKSHYVHRKKRYAENFLVVCNPIGVIIWVDGPFLGIENDRAAWKQSALFTRRSEHFSSGEKLLADGGFDGGSHLLCPVRVSNIHSEDLIEFNVEVSNDRVLVEDVFGWLKARARILALRYGRDVQKHAAAFYAACRWYNALRLLRIEFAIGNG